MSQCLQYQENSRLTSSFSHSLFAFPSLETKPLLYSSSVGVFCRRDVDLSSNRKREGDDSSLMRRDARLFPGFLLFIGPDLSCLLPSNTSPGDTLCFGKRAPNAIFAVRRFLFTSRRRDRLTGQTNVWSCELRSWVRPRSFPVSFPFCSPSSPGTHKHTYSFNLIDCVMGAYAFFGLCPGATFKSGANSARELRARRHTRLDAMSRERCESGSLAAHSRRVSLVQFTVYVIRAIIVTS